MRKEGNDYQLYDINICNNPNLIIIKFNFLKIIKKNIIIKKNNHYFFLLIILVNFSLILSFN